MYAHALNGLDILLIALAIGACWKLLTVGR